MRAARRGGPQWVLLALGLYFLVNMLVRLALPNTLELDEAEQVFLAQFPSLGYGPQPPLYNWLQGAVFALTGPSILGLTLLKNSLLFLTYLFYALTARTVLKDGRSVALATLGLLFLPQMSFMAQQDLTHTVALLAATALFLYALLRALVQPTALGYALLGLSAALGFLAKYNLAILPLAFALAALFDRDLRARLADRRFLIAIVVGLVVTLPHLTWLAQHLGEATSGTLEKMTSDTETGALSALFRGIASFLMAILAFAALLVVLFAVIARRELDAIWKTSTPVTGLIGRAMLFSGACLVIVIALTGATHIRERWLDPFLLVLPLYLALKIEAAGKIDRFWRPALVMLPLLVMVAIPLALWLRVEAADWTGRPTKLNIPSDRLAEDLKSEQDFGAIVTSDRHLAGNLRLGLPSHTVLTSEYPDFVAPVDRSRDILAVWRGDIGTAMPGDLATWLAERGWVQEEPVEAAVHAFPYHAMMDRAYRFHVARLKAANR